LRKVYKIVFTYLCVKNQWMAITSLIISIFGILFIFLGGVGFLLGILASILAIIFSWIFLANKENKEKRGLAMARAVIRGVVLLFSIWIFIVALSFGFPFLS